MLEKYLQQYVDAFGENFPLFAFMGVEDEAINIIKNCLTNNKPYELETNGKILY